MSELYNDLNLTVFPQNVDQFLTFLNITATDGPLIAQYQTALQAGNTTLANQILAQIPSGTQKIIKATDLNKLTQAILAVERFYKTDIEPYVEGKQTEWLSIINQFSYKGIWSIGTSYQVNNLVTYTTSGLTLVYLATSTPPVGTIPTNTQYWRLLTIQGQPGASGEGLSYRQEWNTSTQYQVNDAVTYSGVLWMALQANINSEPGTVLSNWKQIIALEVASYPIQSTEPQGLSQGDLWFNTQNNPTQYYYLTNLNNPAIASDINYGKQSYDEEGNLLIGTNTNEQEIEQGKLLLSDAITNKGVQTSNKDSFQTMANNIDKIKVGESFYITIGELVSTNSMKFVLPEDIPSDFSQVKWWVFITVNSNTKIYSNITNPYPVISISYDDTESTYWQNGSDYFYFDRTYSFSIEGNKITFTDAGTWDEGIYKMIMVY